jgi:surface polysaccharide O-acyltransferase-like enzyme
MVFVVYVTFANKVGDAFSMRKGYSLIWIIILYIVGAWMNRCNIMKCFKIRELLMGLIICILFTWAVKILAPQIIVGDMLVNYTSFTIVYNAIALVGIFSKIKLKLCVKKVVAWLKPATFGVYLIHAHPLIFEYLIEDAFSLIAYSSWWLLVVYVLLYSFGIFMVCLVIEMCRLSIFKLLKINKLTEIIDSRIVKQINRKMEIIIGEEQNDYI